MTELGDILARMLGPLALVVFLALASCSGCASGHPRSGRDAIYPGYTANPYYKPAQLS
jgi:hypothetical protein